MQGGITRGGGSEWLSEERGGRGGEFEVDVGAFSVCVCVSVRAVRRVGTGNNSVQRRMTIVRRTGGWG